MSNYSPIVNYAAKDALSTGNPAKLILGTEISAELTSIASMSTTKEDSVNKNAANGYCGLDGSVLIPVARISAAGVTQHQASLTILETQITDGSLLARVGGTETISAAWNFTAAPQIASIELGHASDTTLSRVSAGLVAVEGVNLVRQGDTIEVGHASDTTLSRIAAGRLAVEGIELGYRGLPSASVTTGAFAASDAGRCVYATGGVTIPNSTMSATDAVVIQNTTGSGITITRSITTAYNTATGAALGATFTLNARGRCAILFTSGTECYVSGNI